MRTIWCASRIRLGNESLPYLEAWTFMLPYFNAYVGEPWVPPSQTVRCEPMPPSAQDATLQGVGTWWRVAWNCNLLNPGEEVRLRIWDGVDKVEYFTVTVRAEGVTQEKGFAFVENR